MYSSIRVYSCRRSLIARYFGELWESTDCDQMCDHCAAAGENIAQTLNLDAINGNVTSIAYLSSYAIIQCRSQLLSFLYAAGDVNETDITACCQDILSILNQCQAQKQRVTALKVIDIWTGKGHANLRPTSVTPTKLLRADAEKVLIHLLLEGYIREDFHFTPYNTISYVLPGKLL